MMICNRKELSFSSVIGVLILAGMALFLIACGQAESPPATATSMATETTAQTLAASGQEIFADKCAVCHGSRDRASLVPRSLA
jgi:mono/diheme cytochrome c family protein